MYLYTVAFISLDTETTFAEDDPQPFNVCVVASVDGDTHCPMDFNATFIVNFIRLSGECALRQCMLIIPYLTYRLNTEKWRWSWEFCA